jgi:uncharacterized membrane protein YhaH (DUF805 family)
MESKFNKICGSCFGCTEIYRLLGQSKGPPVALKVLIAFLAPLVIFIAAAIVAEKIFSDRISSQTLMILVVFLTAFLTTAVYIGIVRLIVKRSVKSN